MKMIGVFVALLLVAGPAAGQSDAEHPATNKQGAAVSTGPACPQRMQEMSASMQQMMQMHQQMMAQMQQMMQMMQQHQGMGMAMPKDAPQPDKDHAH